MTEINESPFTVKGLVTYKLFGPNGELKDERVIPNLITTDGFDFIASALGDTSGSREAAVDYIAVGSDGTAPVVGNTTLGTEIDRKQGAYAHTGGTQSYTIQVTFDPGEATGAIRESGMLNAASGGTLFNRQIFDVINKGSLDSLEVTWLVSFS